MAITGVTWSATASGRIVLSMVSFRTTIRATEHARALETRSASRAIARVFQADASRIRQFSTAARAISDGGGKK
jgi:hypothetical protein